MLLVLRPPDHLAQQRPVVQAELAGEADAGNVDLGQFHGGDVNVVGQVDPELGQGVLHAFKDSKSDCLDVSNVEGVVLGLFKYVLNGIHDGPDGVLDGVLDVGGGHRGAGDSWLSSGISRGVGHSIGYSLSCGGGCSGDCLRDRLGDRFSGDRFSCYFHSSGRISCNSICCGRGVGGGTLSGFWLREQELALLAADQTSQQNVGVFGRLESLVAGKLSQHDGDLALSEPGKLGENVDVMLNVGTGVGLEEGVGVQEAARGSGRHGGNQRWQ